MLRLCLIFCAAVAVESNNAMVDSGFIENDTDNGIIQFIAGIQ
jgi:hypothetical protein